MNERKISKNIKYSVLNYIVINVLKFLVRMVFVKTLSIEYLGVNSLFGNILVMLSLAELGVGPAIIYSLYKPLAVMDKERIKSIMRLFKRVYINIGFTILALGLCLYPNLDCFIKGNTNIEDLKYFYLVFLSNTVVSYFWSYKRSLLIADQKQYIVNIYQSMAQAIVAVLQIVFLLIVPNYWYYIFLMFIGTIFENFIIAKKTDEEFVFLSEHAELIDEGLKKEIQKNTMAMIVHKIGGMVVFGSSNLILSKFVGLAAVGLYSNYQLVITALNAFAGKFFEAITASIGNLIVIESNEKKVKAFKITQFTTALQASVCFCGLYVLFNQFVELWVGKKYLFNDDVVSALVVSFYITYMRKAVLMFRDACGLFWNDRYKPIAESIINLAASIYLTIHYGIVGVIWGSIISTVLTCFWVEPYILLRNAIDMQLKDYFFDYFKFTFVTIGTTILVKYLNNVLLKEVTLLNFVFGIMLCIIVTVSIWCIVFRNREELQYVKRIVIEKLGQ